MDERLSKQTNMIHWDDQLDDVIEISDSLFHKYNMTRAESFAIAVEVKKLAIERDRNNILKDCFGVSGNGPAFFEAIAMQLGYSPKLCLGNNITDAIYSLKKED